MKKTSFEFKQTPFFSSLIRDLVEEKENLKDFYTSIEDLDFDNFDLSVDKRQDLQDSIRKQNSQIVLSDLSTYHLNSITDNNTYTVTTGHQLNIMCGPLFFTYKILTTIRLCEEYKNRYPNKNFVPIYWMASEDHDFEEINHFFLFGKKIDWPETFQNEPVGNAKIETLKHIISDIKDIPDNIKKCYLESHSLNEAHRKLVNELFGKYGILILDANDPTLKKHFLEFSINEIKGQTTQKEVLKSNDTLTSLGYKAQVNPRNLNLFVIENGKRYRLELENNRIEYVDSEVSFQIEEFVSKISQNPEIISPNVLTRPLYQQIILPNIAYVGGPGELAYWLQLKSLFDSNNVAFPLLIPRFFGLYLPKYLMDKLSKANLSISDLLQSAEYLKKRHLETDTKGIELIQNLENTFPKYQQETINLVKQQDNISLVSFAEATLSRAAKEHENIVKRIKKEIEARNSVQLDRIQSIFDNLFPSGEPQERVESVFTFLVNQPDFIEGIYRLIEPLDFRFNIIEND